MTARLLLLIGLVGAVLVFGIVAAGVAAQGPKPQVVQAALGNSFTYQGQLKQNGSPASGTVSLVFKLYSAPTGGSPLGTVNQSLNVVNGLFTTLLDFGSLFDGSERWLGIGIGTDPEMTPRQQLTAAPYALYSTGNWGLSGNAGTSPSTNFLGTTDNQPLVFKTNNAEAMRLDNTGRLGIGINTPVQLFHMKVITGQGEGIRIDSPVAGHAPAIYLNHTGNLGHNFRIASYGDNVTDGSFRIRDETGGFNGGDRLIIDWRGNTGLGTEMPTRRLDVNGVVGVYDGFVKNLNAGVATEVGASLINIGINDDAGNRFGGGYTSAKQGGFLRVDARTGQPLFGFFGRPAASTSPVGDPLVVVLSNGNVGIGNSAPTHTLQLSGGAYSDGITWVNGSDRNMKMNFNDVDAREILAKVAALPIQTWNYKTQDATTRHIGPMAQDFHAAFGVGENDTSISTVDEQGVALAAIQGLYKLATEQDARIAQLESAQQTQQRQIAELQTRQSALERTPSASIAVASSGLSVEWLAIGALVLMNGLLLALVLMHLRRGGHA